MNDLISVIIPVYKVENYIRKCVDCVLGQSYENLEVILVDDGSPDSCGDICDSYAASDKRVRVIHKENGGLSSARNAALEVMTGKWVIFVDSDDYVHRDMVMRLQEAAISKDADIAVCNNFVASDGKLIIGESICDETLVMDSTEGLRRLLEDTVIRNYAWGKLYRAELFEGVRYPEGMTYEDIPTTYLLFDKAKRIVKIPDYLYYYAFRSGSISYAMTQRGFYDSSRGQAKRAEYLKAKGYKELYDMAMAVLLPYLFAVIKGGYQEGAKKHVEWGKKYIRGHREEFLSDPLVLDKDKKLIDVYTGSRALFKAYGAAREGVRFVQRRRAMAKRRFGIGQEPIDFGLDAGKEKRVVYFELPCFDNLGDHAIAYATRKLLEEICRNRNELQFFVVKGWETERAIHSLKKQVGAGDVILCQGGGNFGSLYDFAENLRRKVMRTFAEQKIVIMPQTVFYSEDSKGEKELAADREVISACRDITILARDEKSYELFKGYFDAPVIKLHDVVTSLDMSELASDAREGIVLCLRSDAESALGEEDKLRITDMCEEKGRVLVTDTCTNYDIDEEQREAELLDKLRLWSSAGLVVTDRLHGMIFSYITCTPCVVLGNNHHKVRETFNTLRDCGYIRYTDSTYDIPELISELAAMDTGKLCYKGFPEDLRVLRDLITERK